MAKLKNLDELLAGKAEEILAIISAGGDSHRAVAVLSEYVKEDYHGRFLIELLQNANDQAVKCKKLDANVVIVRTENSIAVANQGDPFDDAGIRSLTSLGLSQKDPTELIGNKGIGFKAVFEVSENPEIISSASSNTGILEAPAWAFRLSTTPFEGAEGEVRLGALSGNALRARPNDAARLGDDAAKQLELEMKHAAPFRFPIPLSGAEVEARIESLPEAVKSAQTLVILPLINSAACKRRVDAAFGELLAYGGSLILFLQGITELKILDLVAGTTIRISKQRQHSETLPGGSSTYVQLVTSVERAGLASTVIRWHCIESMMGSEPGSSNALNLAAKKLPGQGWSQVERVPVIVALPSPQEISDAELAKGGRLCIGLPTLVHTGVRAWIHSHFFGTISRKDVDLRDCEFNKLLFQHAVALHRLLIDHLQKSTTLMDRQLATLAFHRSEGPLADELFKLGADASGKIILASDGFSFLSPAQTFVTTPHHYDIAAKIIEALPTAQRRSADRAIAIHTPALLRKLVKEADQFGWQSQQLLSTDGKGYSAIEYAAKKHRSEGECFWAAFLGYILSLDGLGDRIRERKILPVLGGALLSANDVVFLAPVRAALTPADEDGAEDGESIQIDDLPDHVVGRLNIFDTGCVSLRLPEKRALNSLGNQLVSDNTPLVRRPRRDELINYGIFPALKSLSDAGGTLADGLWLLRLAAQWLNSDSGIRSRVMMDRALVPVYVTKDDKTIRWISAAQTYFGKGWLESEREKLLQQAYAHRTKTMIVDWSEVEASMQGAQCDEWRSILESLGVNSVPALLEQPRRSVPPLHSTRSGLAVTQPTICPIPAASRFWPQYLHAASQRSCSVTSGQAYGFSRISWVDGLEDDLARQAVVALMLLHPGRYEAALDAQLARFDTSSDATSFWSFWVYSFRNNDWPLIPTDAGMMKPSHCWFLKGQERISRQNRYDRIAIVSQGFASASRILRAIGVGDLDEPKAVEIIRELARLSEKANTDDGGASRQLAGLAEDLYAKLQRVVAVDGAPNAKIPPKSLLPVLRQGRLVGIPATELREVWLNDDSARAEFIRDLDSKLQWPIHLRHGVGVVGWLRTQLGAPGSVTLVSEASVETGFEPTAPGRSLTEWITAAFSESVIVDIGCLIAYGGLRPTDPTKEQFREVWAKFQRAVIVPGNFVDSRTEVFVEARATPKIEIQYRGGLNPVELVSHLWRLVGSTYEAEWLLYTTALSKDLTGGRDFLTKRRAITDRDREDVEFGIGFTSKERIDQLKSALLAVYLSKGHGTVGEFEALWKSCRGGSDVSRIFAVFCDRNLLSAALASHGDEACLKIVRAADVGIADWQRCRGLLGLAPYSFVESVTKWNAVREHLVALLKVAMARLASVDLGDARLLLDQIEALSVPSYIEHMPVDGRGICWSLLLEIEKLLNTQTRRDELAMSRIEQLKDKTPEDVDDLRLAEDAPLREVEEYRDKPIGEREALARSRLPSLIEVAVGVAKALKEPLDEKLLHESPLLKEFSEGYWANRYTLIHAFGLELKAIAPKTLERMRERGAFRIDYPPNELKQLFPELTEGEMAPPVPPPRTIQILGHELSADNITKDLGAGANGELGSSIKASACAEAHKLVSLTGTRTDAPHDKSREQYRGKSGARSNSNPHLDEDNKLNGQLGEVFVYELLRTLNMPSFDAEAWLSTNRIEYTGYKDGDDSKGCDFQFRDDARIFLPKSTKRIFKIEVKASSGDAKGPFRITPNEWERAIDASHSKDTEYVIIRVAHVRTKPTLADLIQDPFALSRAAKLRLSSGEFLVYPGQPVVLEPPPKATGEQVS
jgi:hypothetical protein